MESGEFCYRNKFMVFKFSKSQTVEIFRIFFLLSHLGWKELKIYLSFTEISEFVTDLRLITWTLFERFWIY